MFVVGIVRLRMRKTWPFAKRIVVLTLVTVLSIVKKIKFVDNDVLNCSMQHSLLVHVRFSLITGTDS